MATVSDNIKYDAAYASTTATTAADRTTSTAKDNHNGTILANLQIDDLLYLEKDLDFYEKVSLLFLCYGGTEQNLAKIALQKLLTGQYTASTTFLSDWASNMAVATTDWKHVLVEALCIIKANFVLLKLGFSLFELNAHYLPHQMETNLHVHPVAKGLYFVCEQMTKPEATAMINHVESAECPNARGIRFDEQYLEVYLLKWLSEGIIDAGDWTYNGPTRNRQNHCNVSRILAYLKVAEKQSLYDALQRVSIRMNFTSRNVITGGKDSGKKIAVDEDTFVAKGNPAASQPKQCNNVETSSTMNDAPMVSKLGEYVIRSDHVGHVLIINQKNFEGNSNVSIRMTVI